MSLLNAFGGQIKSAVNYRHSKQCHKRDHEEPPSSSNSGGSDGNDPAFVFEEENRCRPKRKANRHNFEDKENLNSKTKSSSQKRLSDASRNGSKKPQNGASVNGSKKPPRSCASVNSSKMPIHPMIDVNCGLLSQVQKENE